MDSGTGSSIPELKDFRIDTSWIPATPAKPGLPAALEPICEIRQENEPIQANWSNLQGIGQIQSELGEFSQGSDARAGDAKRNLTNGGILNLPNFSIDNGDNWNNMSFGSLLALAHASGTTTPLVENAAAQTSLNSLFSSQNADGSSGCSRNSINLNCLPVRDADSSTNTTFQFTPITPTQNKGKESLLNLNLNLNINEMPIPKDVQENDEESGVQGKKEQSVLVREPSELGENHKLDKEGGELGTEVKTPQQKPRRKKHRPKVIIEGQANKRKNKPTPSTPAKEEIKMDKKKNVRGKGVDKPVATTPSDEGSNVINPEKTPPGSNETSKVKGQYPKRNRGSKAKKDPIEEGSSETTQPEMVSQPETVSRPRRSCRRSLNFECLDLDLDVDENFIELSSNFDDSNLQNICKEDKTTSGPQLEADPKADAELAEVNITYDAPDPSTPCKTDSTHDKLIVGDQDKSTRGKCKIVFSDVTHDKEDNLPGMTSSQNSSNSSSNACLTEEAQVRGSKRQHSSLAEPELYNTDIARVHHNSLQAYQSVLSVNGGDNIDRISGLHFPTIYKKKRTEKGHIPATSSKNLKTETHNMIVVSANASANAANGSQSPKHLQPLNTDMFKRKRSKGLTRVRDLASLHEICKQFPSSSKEATGKQHIRYSNTCMEALVADTRPTLTTKKRSKRNSSKAPIGSLPALTWRDVSPIEEITERLNYLDINGDCQGRYALLTSNAKFQRESALVVYRRDGTITPFVEVKKRKPRPKVDLDDETTRVWKLLLQDINSQGIDGTDEEKTKWWEEERNVFQGRADSFIARMRLVQGDRRFSPWKGSVVDSVVGVFLTQNVSDHLSSSAFMSMAARFPLKSNASAQLHEEGTNVTIEEPEVCVMDPDDTIAWHEGPSNQPTPGQGSMIFRDKTVNSESTEDTSNCIQSTEKSKETTNSSSKNDPDVYCGLTLGGPANWINKEDESFHSGQTEPDHHVLSSQNSGVSSQNSVDSSSHAQTTESSSLSSAASFVQLLHMAGTSMLKGDCSVGFQKNKDDDTGSLNTIATNQKIQSDQFEMNLRKDKDPMVSFDSQIRTEESLEITERASTVVDPQSNSDGQNKHLNTVDRTSNNLSKEKGRRPGKEKQDAVNWDILRQEALASDKKTERTFSTMDSLDWEAVRCADVNEIAETIKERGMNNMLAERIKDFLNRLVREHGSTDLEWLRDVPPDKAKEYLLSFRGLGLKSVECVRLLTLHHLAFPVDTNVGRIAVRLGWVPLQPLPESLQLHLLELYPVLESIQKYLWPRLCKLDQGILYELHYHMITFGKVFCTKSKPNCNACPMRAECRHFASAFASARLALPAPEDKSILTAFENKSTGQNSQNPIDTINPLWLSLPQSNQQLVAQYDASNSQPIIEEPKSPEPIIDVPATPEQIPLEADIEDAYGDDPNEIPTINLNLVQLAQNVKMFVENNMELSQAEMSKALVALTPDAASIPMPKLKNISRLRTEHHVYEIPDDHPLLAGMERRDPDDPCSYLLAIWTPGETANSVQPPERRCDSQESGILCHDETCLSCNSIREAQSRTVRGTILMPCRTAMRGSFPLNGTYFQVNEVFADHESSLNPIDVPRDWLWNLHRKTVFFGTSIPTIFKGLSTEDIQHCFWRGYVCVRGFDRKTRAPRPLMARLHFPASKLIKAKRKVYET